MTVAKHNRFRLTFEPEHEEKQIEQRKRKNHMQRLLKLNQYFVPLNSDVTTTPTTPIMMRYPQRKTTPETHGVLRRLEGP